MTVPVYLLTCRTQRAALDLAGMCRRRGYIGAEANGNMLLLPWGGPADALFTVGGWARDCDLAGDVEVSRFYMQAARLTSPKE